MTDSCQDGTCHLRLPHPVSTRCLTRVDGCDALASPDCKCCDFLLFVQSSSRRGHWVAPIELKGGTVKKDDLDGIRRQLQTGAGVAARLVVSDDAPPVRLRPILGHGKALPALVGRLLTTDDYHVTLGGRREIIRTLECSGEIAEVLK